MDRFIRIAEPDPQRIQAPGAAPQAKPKAKPVGRPKGSTKVKRELAVEDERKDGLGEIPLPKRMRKSPCQVIEEQVEARTAPLAQVVEGLMGVVERLAPQEGCVLETVRGLQNMLRGQSSEAKTEADREVASEALVAPEVVKARKRDLEEACRISGCQGAQYGILGGRPKDVEEDVRTQVETKMIKEIFTTGKKEPPPGAKSQKRQCFLHSFDNFG